MCIMSTETVHDWYGHDRTNQQSRSSCTHKQESPCELNGTTTRPFFTLVIAVRKFVLMEFCCQVITEVDEV